MAHYKKKARLQEVCQNVDKPMTAIFCIFKNNNLNTKLFKKVLSRPLCLF